MTKENNCEISKHANIVSVNRNHLLDILKGICILMVILTHYIWGEQYKNMLLFPFWVDMAVPIFMIISGYVYAMSFSRKRCETFESTYAPNELWKKFIRYTIPFIIAFIIEEIVFALGGKPFGFARLIFAFISGGNGPGSYYYPIMCQLLLIFPPIYFIVKKNKDKGLLFCLVFNAVYELIKTAYSLPTSTYRLLIFRYVFLIAFGCYFYLYGEGKKVNKASFFICLIIGILWEIIVNYTNYETIIINNAWAGTSFMCGFYIIPLFVLIFNKKKALKCKPFEALGKASYHIFLVQMVYFETAQGFVYSLIPSVLGRILANFLICITVGYLFFIIEKPLGKIIYDKTTRLFAYCFENQKKGLQNSSK